MSLGAIGAATGGKFGVDVLELKRALQTILEPGQVTEIRALGATTSDSRWPHVISGYFNDMDQLVQATVRIQSYQGIYFIPNPVNPALMARAQNRVRRVAEQPTTADHEIIARRWLLIDIDPVRPSGISSSEAEHRVAVDKAREIVDALSGDGFPEPLVADSGNGTHILYRIDVPVNDDELVKRAVAEIAVRFDSPEVRVDKKVFNPSRIWKLPGTWARKGDNSADRPHRLAKLLEVPNQLDIVPLRLLKELAVTPPTTRGNTIELKKSEVDVARWIEQHGLELVGPKPWKGGQRWIFPICPWNPSHRKSAFIVQLEGGSISAGCLHNSCRDKRWSDLRAIHESWNGGRPKSSDPRESFPALAASSGTTTKLGVSKPELMAPGEHDGLRVGHHDVVETLRRHLPLGKILFRRGTDFIQLVGEPGGRNLHPLSANMLRVLIDDNVDLVRTRTNKLGPCTTQYQPCSRDLAGAVLAAFSCDAQVPECKTMASFPVWVRSRSRGWNLPRPGYDCESGHFFDATEQFLDFSPRDLDPSKSEDKQLVQNLLATDKPGIFQHFPWANEGSAVNVLAAVLTILMRPGIQSPTPMFIFTAPLTRSGKTLLASSICRLTSGREVCIQSLPENEGEIRKGLVSSLREGATVILFDNVMPGTPVSSAALAAFVTSSEFGSRLLGQIANVSYPNRTILFMTGNNLALSRELSSRALPIELLPSDARPEARAGLPFLPDLIIRDRLAFLSILHGMIQAWTRKSEPPWRAVGLGGFEDWQKTVGGVLALWGFGERLGSNIPTWRSEADTETFDVERFLIVWQTAGGETRDWSARELLNLTGREGLFPEIFVREEHGRLIAFSKSVLLPLINVPREVTNEVNVTRKFRVIRRGSAGSHRGFQYRLDVR